jgi:hypothetical protein
MIELSIYRRVAYILYIFLKGGCHPKKNCRAFVLVIFFQDFPKEASLVTSSPFAISLLALFR